jgi:hypothetical protein
MQNVIFWVGGFYKYILHQTNNYARTFHFVQKCPFLFLARNHQYKKGHVRKKLGPIFSDSACFCHIETTEQVDETFFSFGTLIHRRSSISFFWGGEAPQ